MRSLPPFLLELGSVVITEAVHSASIGSWRALAFDKVLLTTANMSERKRLQMGENMLGDLGSEDCTIHFGEDIEGNPRQADGELLPTVEVRRI